MHIDASPTVKVPVFQLPIECQPTQELPVFNLTPQMEIPRPFDQERFKLERMFACKLARWSRHLTAG